MPTVSIKLADDTKRRLDIAAAGQGIKPHALMVRAIESSLAQAAGHQSFVAAALRTRQSSIQTGLVMDGIDYSNFLKARVRGIKAKRPELQSIESLLRTSA